MSQAYAAAFNDIRAAFNTLFGDVLKWQLKDFQDYVWMITDSIRDAFANMVAGIVTEWIKGMATMANVKAAYNWLFPSTAAAVGRESGLPTGGCSPAG